MHHWRIGGGERDRTDDLLLAKQALSQLSYTPDKTSFECLVMSFELSEGQLNTKKLSTQH